MLPENLEWYFPETADEAVELIARPGTILHAGGTRILKTRPESIRALADIGKMKLNFINYTDNSFYIGAGSTFDDVIKYFELQNKLPMLADSLLNSSSTPLRNRITIGGSVKDFPIWSSLYAPLIALNAKIDITGEITGIFPVESYVSDKIINSTHLIKQVIIDEVENQIGAVKRFSVVKFEYPVFTIAAAFIVEDNIISQSRLVVTGVPARYQRFPDAENILDGKALTDEVVSKAVDMIKPEFTSDYRYSANYKNQMAKVYFKDLLLEISRRNKK